MGITQSMKYILTSVVLIVERSAAMLRHSARLLCIASLLAALPFGVHPTAAAPDAYDPWPGLVQDIF
jgi:hypothetical protein